MTEHSSPAARRPINRPISWSLPFTTLFDRSTRSATLACQDAQGMASDSTTTPTARTTPLPPSKETTPIDAGTAANAYAGRRNRGALTGTNTTYSVSTASAAPAATTAAVRSAPVAARTIPRTLNAASTPHHMTPGSGTTVSTSSPPV
jgi:hypothetical protein